LPAGAPFSSEESFTQDGIVWLREHACWIPEDVLSTGGPPDASWPAGLLEADVPAGMLGSFQTAINAGALETFDPMDGFTGIRLRGANPYFRVRWHSGERGVREILTAVDAEVQNR
jgi:hypothetical protein